MDTIMRDVESASQLMRRYYCTTKETMRSMAGYLPKMQSWPGKKMLARHIWLDALHADMLRSRALDLRYPRVDVDDQSDFNLIRFLHHLPSTPTDEHFLTSIYLVLKPSLLTALKSYLTHSDPLDDAPSHVYLNRIIVELELQLSEFEMICNEYHLCDPAVFDVWSKVMFERLHACGGVDGLDRDGDISPTIESQYELPMEGGREASWEPAVMQVPPRAPENILEHQIWIAIDHVNEVWASETAAGLIWQYDNMPWRLYYNAARWCYDEMRHAMMGEQRLTSMGLRIGMDYPMVADHWRVFRPKGMDTLLLLLHGLEQKGPLHKSKLKKELMAINDFDGAQDCDYDWADESNHISIGLDWIKVIHPDWSKQRIMTETAELVEEWRDWITRRHQEGNHGYETFIVRIDERVKMLSQGQGLASSGYVPTHLSN